MDLETLLSTLATEGYHVDLLHQSIDGTWQGSIRVTDEPWATYPCQGPTALSVLASAYHKACHGIGRRVEARVAYTIEPSQSPDLAAIMAKLIPKTPLKRRV